MRDQLLIFFFSGWANTLFAGETEGAEGFQFFTVSVSLTEDGLGT